ncbi:hypothetical protein DPMN_180787 [Dreissena polymorpha]|uniref:Uncharacterized protein n=1 Tax=Dreissena polymorpha TaxID=45954 RepID=A0A9D4I334_DREPO|nr:hypothetical protein DPMN_180787 [Dreissena polymorpha]
MKVTITYLINMNSKRGYMQCIRKNGVCTCTIPMRPDINNIKKLSQVNLRIKVLKDRNVDWLGAAYTGETDHAMDHSRSRAYDYSPKSYRAVNRWSDSECRDYLNWCLEGKALDYFTIETSMGEWLSYTDIMLKMERRFGTKELLELSKVKFHQAIQGQQESLEEWADRVLTLATPAF